MQSNIVRDELLVRLSVMIGMIMEDHADEAVSMLSPEAEESRQRFSKLHQAGSDIAALASAAEVLLRRRL